MKNRKRVISFIAYTQCCSEDEAVQRFNAMPAEKRQRLFDQVNQNRRKSAWQSLHPLSRARKKRRMFAF